MDLQPRPSLCDIPRATLLRDMGYETVANLSSGGFGQVVVMRRPGSAKFLAAKMVVANNTSKEEMDVWKTLVHPHILPLYETVEIPSQTYTFLTPLVEMTLGRKILSRDFRSDENALDSLKKWFIEILSALQYLHDHHLCHGDLKDDNVLVSRESNAIVCDFTMVGPTTKPTRKLVSYSLDRVNYCFHLLAKSIPFKLIGINI